MTLKELIDESFLKLKTSGSPTPRLDTEIILAHALNTTRLDLLIRLYENLPAALLPNLEALIERRARGEPVAYITEEKEFYGRSFWTPPGVLIPRPETEFLVEQVLKYLKNDFLPPATRILDLGSGSGAIGLSLLAEIPEARLLAIDISPRAQAVTHKNSEQLKVSARLSFALKDAAQISGADLPPAFLGQVDVVVANPPYIAEDDGQIDPNVKRYEPAEALFAGPLGWEPMGLWTQAIRPLLAERALMIFEIGSGQGAKAVEMMHSLNIFETILLGQDYAGWDRWVLGLKNHKR